MVDKEKYGNKTDVPPNNMHMTTTTEVRSTPIHEEMYQDSDNTIRTQPHVIDEIGNSKQSHKMRKRTDHRIMYTNRNNTEAVTEILQEEKPRKQENIIYKQKYPP